jgi:transposase
LTTIPGIDAPSACVILAEIGHDMSRFSDRQPSDLLGRSMSAQ